MRFSSYSLPCLCAVAALMLVSGSQSSIAAEEAAIARQAPAFELRHTMTFSEESLRFGSQMGLDTVSIEGGDWLNVPGEPLLPARTVRIAVPEGMAVTGVRVLSTESVELSGEFTIAPGRAPMPASVAIRATNVAAPSADTATPGDAYPGKVVEFTHQSDLAGQAFAVLRVYPLQYIATEKKLVLHTSIEIGLEGDGGYVCGDYLPQSISEVGRETCRRMVSDMVVNPESVRLQAASSGSDSTRGVEPGDYDYVIITHADWVDDFAPLADWKTKKGTPAKIVELDWIYDWGGYSGDKQSQIRQFVEDARNNWGAMYFLLGGDSNVVPFSERYLLGEEVPNDTYYADYDDDWVCEVHLGRAPVQDDSMVATFIDKVLTYEKNPPLSDYAKNAFFCGFDMSSSGSYEGQGTKVAIKGNYLPPSWTYRSEYDSEGGSHLSDVIGYINEGANLLNHVDHASWAYMGTGDRVHGEGLSISDMETLHNGDKQGIFYSIGCLPAAFTEDTCIGEAFVRNPNGGGVAFVGNTRSGWFMQYSDDGYSLGFDRVFFRSLFEQGHYILGDCFSDHKNDYYQSDEYYQFIFTELSLLGDPQLPIWTEDPTALMVTHPETLVVGEYTDYLVEKTDGK